MMIQLDPGTTLAAVQAMSERDVFTREQVAYLVDLAYRTGQVHNWADEMAETVACWQEFAEPLGTRERQVHRRLADMERIAGPARFPGGLPKPPNYYPAEPDRKRPPFPTLGRQAEWLTAEDIAFCRDYAADPSLLDEVE